MTIEKIGTKMKICAKRPEYNENPYTVCKGENGKNYVARNTAYRHFLNVSDGNTKTGPAVNLNMPIEYTCNHNCECYKTGKCYAENGCYNYSSNQVMYSENLNFFLDSTNEEFCNAVQISIDQFGYCLFRYFTCGDIVNSRFFDCMVQIAINNPSVEFWAYTKKYSIVNNWIAKNGGLPENLTIIFSHWLNEDGTYYPMENPYNLPTSEFIPYGKENMIDKSYHVCPCSDPTVKATCATCDKPCYRLKKGEHMALCEHSTQATKERDKALREAKSKL